MNEVRALLLTDVVDSTALGQSLGDDAMAALWAAHDRLARELLPPHRGREIDKTDGMLLMFERADDAVAYARAYHAALATLEPPLRARAGLHVGPVVLRENPADDVARGAKPIEVDGIAKPTAARVMALACGGQTLLTLDALQALHAAGAAPRAHGHWHVKGVAEPIELFELADGPGTTPPDGDKAYRVARVGDRWLPLREVPNNLPRPASSFVGRGGEIDEIKALLRQARLLSLVAMGGLGKTRLALQAAAELLAEFPDGAWFLDLAPLREPARVVEEAARLLGVQEEAGRPLVQTLCAQLRERRLLLVVDNCEHLVDAAAALIDALLRAAPDLCVLATSRTVLRVSGERVVPVLPLPLPHTGDDAKALAQSGAVRLFVERAQAQRPDFAPDAREVGQVAELVARLEGIPLAIELAAARVRALSVADINARLADRYRLLTGGSRVAEPRQQTLRALVDWSYELLQPPEQTLLQRLGVFAGGFDLTAAEAVCGVDPIDPLDVVDLVDSLVEKSLVMPDRGADGTRYRMLETLREYAREKLDASGDAAAIAARHCEHFWALARQVRDGLQGPQQPEWARRGEADLDNLRAAIATARRGDADPMLAAKLPVALQGFWVMRGRLAEGRAHVQAALELPAVQASDVARAHILYVAAVLADAQGDAAEACRLLETCLALRRQAQDTAGTAETLSTLSMALLAIGRPHEALSAEQEALELFRQLSHRLGEAIALPHLAHITLHLGQTTQAREHALHARVVARERAYLEMEGECEWLLAEVAQAEGDAATALAHLQASLQSCRKAGDRSGEARALGALGRHALHAGDLETAHRQLGDALRAFRAYEMRRDLIVGLEDHADLAAELGQDDTAVHLRAAAVAARAVLGLARAPYLEAQSVAREAALHERLGDAGYRAAWAQGESWALATAYDAALAVAPQQA